MQQTHPGDFLMGSLVCRHRSILDMCNGNTADLRDLNILSRFTSPDPGMHWVPNKNPGSDSDTVCLKRDRVQTCHASDPIYIVSCADTSCWLPEESRDRVGRSLELDLTRTSSHPGRVSRGVRSRIVSIGRWSEPWSFSVAMWHFIMLLVVCSFPHTKSIAVFPSGNVTVPGGIINCISCWSIPSMSSSPC